MRSRITSQPANELTIPDQVDLSMTLAYEEVVPERVEVYDDLHDPLQHADTLPPYPREHEAGVATTEPYATDLFEQLGQLLAMEWGQLDEMTLASLKANWEESRQWLLKRPDQILPMLLRSYENAVHQNRAIQDLQRELRALRKRVNLASMQADEPSDPSLAEKLDEAQKRLEEHRQWLADHPDAMLLLDAHQTVSYANPAAERLLGLTYETLQAQPLGLPLSCNPTEYPYKGKDGQQRIFEVQSVETCWEGDKGFMVVLRDITHHKQSQEQWQQVALHDALTGLPNRLLFLDRLGQAMQRIAREPQRKFAVLFLDLDGFKDINDSLGHPCGDALLKTLSARISRCVRSCDTVARLGGDEFTLLLEDIQDAHAAAVVAERILHAISKRVVLQGEAIHLSASIGVAMSHPRYTTPEDLLEDADLAMYQAKARGKARLEIFKPATKQLPSPQDLPSDWR